MIYISLGSNVEPRAERLAQARTALSELGAIVKTSPIYETEPLTLPGTSITNHAWVLNQVVALVTTFEPLELLRALKKIEHSQGRQARPKWSDREIDLDILAYHNVKLHTEELTLPHPELAKRKFVLVPLVDIAPQFDPLLAECTDILTIRPYEPGRN